MGSITTNSSSAALIILRGVNKDLNTVQEQVSSGYRVRTASDDPSYWSMANTMRSDNTSLSTVQDALGLGSAKVDTAYTAMQSAIDLVTQIRSKLVTAKEAGVDKDQINSDLADLKSQLQGVVQSASFSGENWLYNTNQNVDATKSVISGFVRGTAGQVYLTSVDYDSSKSLLIDTVDPSRGLLTKDSPVSKTNADGSVTTTSYHLLNADSGTAAGGTEISLSSDTTGDQIDDMVTATNSILASLTSAGAAMGVMKSRIDNQSTFVSSMVVDIKTSVGNLVDTNMEEASSRVTALQTAQQMAVQSLSIANTMASKMLILLGGT